MRLRTLLLIFALGVATGVTTYAESAIGSPSPNPLTKCNPARSIIVKADQSERYYYCDKNGNIQDLPIAFKDGTSLTVAVENINPLTENYSISIHGTKFAEMDGSSLLSFLHVSVNDTKSTPAPGQPSTTKATPKVSKRASGEKPQSVALEPEIEKENDCIERYTNGEHQHVLKLYKAFKALTRAANQYNDKVASEQAKYNHAVEELESTPNPGVNSFKKVVKGYKFELPKPNPTVTRKLNYKLYPDLKSLDGTTLDDAAVVLSNHAMKLYGGLDASVGLACKNKAAFVAEVNKDKTSLQSIFTSTDKSLSTAQKLETEVQSTNTLVLQVKTQERILRNIITNPNNYNLYATIAPEDRIQSTVAVAVTCTARDLSGSALAGQQSGSKNGTIKTAKKVTTAKSCASSAGSTSFTVNFGQGPRVFESAGLVFSHLSQPSYSTIAPGASATCTASAAPGGCIVKDKGNGWRILPVGLVSVRLIDVPRSPWRVLVPNYFSFGATIKSNASSATHLEYLTGLSWASPGQHVFFTAGGYAGTATRLAAGLSVGAQTVAPSATLPTTNPYHWGFGFAISFRFASQGGGAPKKQNTPSQSK